MPNKSTSQNYVAEIRRIFCQCNEMRTLRNIFLTATYAMICCMQHIIATITLDPGKC